MPPLDRRPAGSQPLSRPARLAAAALGRRWRLPAATNAVRVLRGVDVPMRDGTVLRADVYLPASDGPHPTVLLRSPYGRGAGFALTMAVPYAERGYAVVLQSVRGTFGSGGEFSPGRQRGARRAGHRRLAARAGVVRRPARHARPQLPRLHAVGAGARPAARAQGDGAAHRAARPRAGRPDRRRLPAHQPGHLDRARRPPGAGQLAARAPPADDGGAPPGPAPRRAAAAGTGRALRREPGALVRRVAGPPRPRRPLLGPLPRHPGRALRAPCRRCSSAAGRTGSSSRRSTSTPSCATAASTSASPSARGRTSPSTPR